MTKGTELKLSISQSALVKATSIATKAAPSKEAAFPVLNGMLIDVSEGTMTLKTTDMDVSMTTTAPCYVEEDGRAIVPARIFEKIVKSLPDAAVTLETKGTSTTISCGKTKFRLNGMNPNDFPETPNVESLDSVVEIPISLLSELVERTYKTVSKDKSRPILNGIQLSVEDNVVRAVSTDSYRLAVCDGPLSDDENGTFSAIVPGSALRDILKLAANAETITVGMTNSCLVFCFGTSCYTTRRIEGNYPNWKQLISREYSTMATIDVSMLCGALKRVGSIIGSNPAVTLGFADDELTIMTTDVNNGEGTESIPVQLDGNPVTIGVNATYLGDCVNSIKEDEATLEMGGPLDPCVFKVYGAVNYLHLLMPVRI